MNTEMDPKLLPRGDGTPSGISEGENIYDCGLFLNEEVPKDSICPEIKSDRVINVEIEAVPGCSGAVKISGPVLADVGENLESEDVMSSRRASGMSLQSTMDSEIIDLDTYVFTNSSLISKSKKEKRKKRRLIISSSDSDKMELELTKPKELLDKKAPRLTEIQRNRLSKEMIGLEKEHVSHINAKVQSWLDRLEHIRKVTTNMNCEQKGEMKVLLMLIKKANEVITLRASAAGDPKFLEGKIDDLVMENSDLRIKVDALEKLVRHG